MSEAHSTMTFGSRKKCAALSCAFGPLLVFVFRNIKPRASFQVSCPELPKLGARFVTWD